MSKKENILSDELLIAFINKELSDDELEVIENNLENDDEAFARFAILNQSIKKINSVLLEVTPDVLRKKLHKEYGVISKSKPKSIFDKIMDKVNIFTNIFSQPGTAITVIATACIVLLMIGPFLGDEEVIDNPKDISAILNKIKEKQKRMISTSGSDMLEKHMKMVSDDANELPRNRYNSITKANKKSFIISIDKNNMIIEQKFKIIRDLTIISLDKSKIINKRIKEIVNTIDITEFKENDSLRVVLETVGTIVFDDWVKR